MTMMKLVFVLFNLLLIFSIGEGRQVPSNVLDNIMTDVQLLQLGHSDILAVLLGNGRHHFLQKRQSNNGNDGHEPNGHEEDDNENEEDCDSDEDDGEGRKSLDCLSILSKPPSNLFNPWSLESYVSRNDNGRDRAVLVWSRNQSGKESGGREGDDGNWKGHGGNGNSNGHPGDDDDDDDNGNRKGHGGNGKGDPNNGEMSSNNGNGHPDDPKNLYWSLDNDKDSSGNRDKSPQTHRGNCKEEIMKKVKDFSSYFREFEKSVDKIDCDSSDPPIQ